MPYLKRGLFACLLGVVFSFYLFAQEDNNKEIKKRMGLHKPYLYYKAMGDKMRNMEQYDLAIKNYDFALVLNPDCGECYFYLALLKYRKKLYGEAIKELEIGIYKNFDYDLDRLKAWYFLAALYFQQKKYGQAEELLLKLIEEYEAYQKRSYQIKLIQPSYYAPAYFLLGLYQRNTMQMNEKTLSYFQKCIDLNYKKDMANFFIHEYYKAQGPQFNDYTLRFYSYALHLNKNIESDLQQAKWLYDYDLFETMEEDIP